MSGEFNQEAFEALQFMVRYARDRNRVRLAQVKARAREAGFSQESVEEAVKFWAEYEAKKG